MTVNELDGGRRRPRLPVILAIGLLAVVFGFAVANVLVGPGAGSDGASYEILGNLFPLGFPIVGAVIASKRPDNPIGWVFLGGTAITIAGVFLGSVVESDIHGASAATDYAAAVLFLSGIGLMSVLFLVFFPDGNLPSRRWRFVPLIGVAGVILNAAWVLVRECSIVSVGTDDLNGIGCTETLPAGFARFPNPFGWAYPGGEGLWNAIGATASAMVIAGLFLGGASLVVRFRNGTPIERTQLKWPLSVVALAMPIFGAIVVADTVFGVDTQAASFVVFLLLFTGLPMSIGIAITRHNLFDIDRLINRVAVYTLIAILIAGIYTTLSILPMTLILGADGTEQPPWLVAASTLVAAGSFSPIRRRVQAFVDRRFYRSHYDAVGVIARIGSLVRDSTDIAVVRELLVESASAALSPGSVSVWLAD